jgi:hypothetical protein
MSKEIPVDLIETLMDFGLEDKQSAQHKDELIASLKSAAGVVGKYTSEDWQNLCDTLSRESHTQLFRGLVFAGIFAWGPSATAPVRAVFSGLNKRCWPDTVYSLIRWAIDVCEAHNFDPEEYGFALMLQNR